ncbi:MAG: hypothetical protein V2I33_15360, partial [Kangiellaceae bacterium]|nr:hypothetical protein [Kangiellaceae bacterium]
MLSINHKLSLKFAALSCLSFITPSLFADDSGFRINGFANIVVGSTFDSDESTYGYDDTLDFGNESLFALQFTKDMGDGLSATAQVVSRAAQNYETEFAWAYLAYEMSDQTQIKFGRLRVPFYTYSEFVEVGYTYHWIRPPQTVYALPFDNADGVNYSFTSSVGNWDSRLELLYGRYNGITTPGDIDSPSDLRDLTSVVWGLSQDEWSFRFAYTSCGECQINVPLEQVLGFDLLGTLNQVGAGSTASRIAFDGDAGFFADIGARYDNGDWFVETELARLEVENTFLGDNDYWYVTAGIRDEEFTWHFTVENVNTESKEYDLSGVPPINIAPGLTLQDVVGG